MLKYEPFLFFSLFYNTNLNVIGFRTINQAIREILKHHHFFSLQFSDIVYTKLNTCIYRGTEVVNM